MKKLAFIGIGLCMVCMLSSCKSSESAYKKAYEQAKQFSAATEVTSLAITKLDGSAKGGVVIGISDQFKIPVRYIGLGEKMEDLQPFNRREFVNTLFDKN